MSAIKDGRYPIMLDRERHLLFSLNVLDELQDKAGGYDKLGEFLNPNGNPNFKNLKWLLALLINEGAQDGEDIISEQALGKLIHTGNLVEMQNSIFRAFSKGNTGNEESQADTEDDEEDDEKNVKSGQDK